MTIFDEIAAAADFGRPSARKSGRNKSWPYVPVRKWTDDLGVEHDEQVLRLAFATREEALEAAERHITALRALLARQLAEPRYRALREQYGLPREIESC